MILRLGALGLLALLFWGGALWYGPRVSDAPPADRALPMDLPEGPLRLTVFGTSLSSPRYDWPEALATALETCRGAPVTLTRVTRAGANISWAETQVAPVRDSAPDLILMEFSANDADLLDGLSLGDARARTEAVLDGLAGIPLVLMTMNPAQGARGVLRPRLGAHYTAYREIAAARDLGLIDFDARWRALPRAERHLDDGLHPDPATAREVILPALRSGLGC